MSELLAIYKQRREKCCSQIVCEDEKPSEAGNVDVRFCGMKSYYTLRFILSQRTE